jgi:hypothetical protein
VVISVSEGERRERRCTGQQDPDPPTIQALNSPGLHHTPPLAALARRPTNPKIQSTNPTPSSHGQYIYHHDAQIEPEPQLLLSCGGAIIPCTSADPAEGAEGYRDTVAAQSWAAGRNLKGKAKHHTPKSKSLQFRIRTETPDVSCQSVATESVKVDEYPELDDILNWIERIYKSSRRFEQTFEESDNGIPGLYSIHMQSFIT